MNIKLHYDNNGKLYKYNEQAFKQEVEYCDNIEEILALENIIEGLNIENEDNRNKIKDLIKKRNQLNKKITAHKSVRKIFIIVFLLSILLMLFGGILSFLSPIITKILVLTEIASVISIFTFGHLYHDLKNYQKLDEINNEINAINIVLIAIKNLLNKKNLELEHQKDISTKETKEDMDNKIVNIEYKKDLLNIKKYLIRMHQYGTNEKYYQNLIRHNDLFDKIYERYDDKNKDNARTIHK